MWMRYFPKDGEFEPNYEGEFRGEFDDTPDTYDDNTTIEERFFLNAEFSTHGEVGGKIFTF